MELTRDMSEEVEEETPTLTAERTPANRESQHSKTVLGNHITAD
jgi:hypothetical protein